MVVHEPGDWLAESLRALAQQDHANTRALILVTGTAEDPGARPVLDVVETELPGAVVRFLGGNPGFPSACNAVLNLVQGDSGFFCFLHDDVALAPDAIGRMVEEMYRSNAGVVGPKLVHWDEPRMIQTVGIAVDRFGVQLPNADDGELDQEQHDAVQDVFVLPGSCLLVRADLFREIGGFDPLVHVAGTDLDFCWRVHSTGARVVVVPAAVARHREAMVHRLAEEEIETIDAEAESARLRTVVSLSSRAQLPGLAAQLTVYTLLRSLLLLVTGRTRSALIEIRALVSLPANVGEVRRRRERVASHRRVDGAEVRALQLRGSAHVTAWARKRARRAGLAQSIEASGSEEQREATPRGAYVMWSALLLILLVGSRRIITDGSAAVGQMVPFGPSARDLFSSWTSGWWGAGFGQVSALPTGIALVATTIVGAFGHAGLARTLAIVLLPLVGWLGAWRFASVMGRRSARIAGTVAYAAAPLSWTSVASGRWGALLVFALFPWLVHLLRMLVGHADLNDARGAEAMVVVSPAAWRRWFAGAALLAAVMAAFEPFAVLLIVMSGAVLAVTTAAQGLNVRWSARWIGTSAAVAGAGIALNLPWAASYVRHGWWESVTGAPVESGRNIGLFGLARFSVGDSTITWMSVLMFASVIGALLVVRGPRALWAMRGAALVVVGMLVAVLDDSALLPAHLVEPAVLLVPVAFGLSVCSATMGASLAVDLRRGRFSWRQPLGALVALAFAVGLVPFAINSFDGRWNQPDFALPQLLAQLPDASVAGDYRTMFIGDERVLPGSPSNFGWGIAYSVVNGRSASIQEMWETPPTRARDNAVAALYGIVRGRTARAGRLLAPLAVRYIVVPIVDGGQSTRSEPIAAPTGLVEALSRQLDLRRKFASPDLVVFENVAWVPVRSVLGPAGTDSSRLAGATSMIATDIAGATALPPAARADAPTTALVPAGTVHLAVPYTSRWRMFANGLPVPVRPAFGLTNAYDIAQESRIRLAFERGAVHTLLIGAQVLAWGALAWMSTNRRRRGRRGPVNIQMVQADGPAIVMAPVIDQGEQQ